ncbi:DUF2938 domain-containing protein [Pseudomonas sp. RA_105y_Pfl1_P41]|uniref:DUF2938 domain-containing protein n=1 Tax=Pseudomonas sp. RA_105y_Pfl1_P41 TaxID=3088700 RepID=UPI0030DCD2D0
MDIVYKAMVIGIIATAVMDLWALLAKRLFNIPSLNYAMVGRWLGNILDGRFTHPNIAHAHVVAGEQVLGWTAHYVIGVFFAMLLLLIMGPAWSQNPTVLAPLLFGIASVAAPFFILQPGMGAGFAASKTPNPTVARARSFMAHGAFGIGLTIAVQLVEKSGWF